MSSEALAPMGYIHFLLEAANQMQGELPSPEQIAERLAGWAFESGGFDGEDGV